MLHDELRQEVTKLGSLRLVAGRVVLDRFRAANVVDSDDEWLDLRVLRGRVEVEGQQAERDERDQNEGDLEVRVHHQGRAVQLHELALGAVQRLRIQVGNGGIHNVPQLPNLALSNRHAMYNVPLTRPKRITIPIATK